VEDLDLVLLRERLGLLVLVPALDQEVEFGFVLRQHLALLLLVRTLVVEGSDLRTQGLHLLVEIAYLFEQVAA